MDILNQAAAHAAHSRLAKALSDGKFDSLLTKYPEVFDPEFWEKLMTLAKNPFLVDGVVEALEDLAEDGCMYHGKIAYRYQMVMRIAHATKRNQTIGSHLLK